ncbi:MAG TPA: phosphatase PAP2 family protein [Solirubrobacteraceae bacterium]|jgi:membrane-associated phospholipid phosphatase|nr:phosphatase PAP2 family protein [Solirubrobacteraceae bacterium]
MRHRPADALRAALVCVVGLVLTGVVALVVPIAQAHDSATLYGFAQLRRPRVEVVANAIAHLVDPRPYAVAAVVLAVVALIRGRPRVAVAVPIAMVLASTTTELLKPLVGHPRASEWLGAGADTAVASWPSGHATASMMIALAAVLVSPRRLRPLVALLGTALAIGVSYSILVLGWHFPSDVLGGFLVAGGWTSLALAGLWAAEARWPERSARGAVGRVATGAGDLLAPAGILALSLGGAIGLVAMRGHVVAVYSASHLSFVAGAATIALLAAALAVAMTFALRPQPEPGARLLSASGPAPTGVRPRRWHREPG